MAGVPFNPSDASSGIKKSTSKKTWLTELFAPATPDNLNPYQTFRAEEKAREARAAGPSAADAARITAGQKELYQAMDKQGLIKKATSTGTGTGSGSSIGRSVAPAVNPIDALFKPSFDLLAQQRKANDARYKANLGDITNIYGQLTTRRQEDISSSATAFKNLQDAAAARSTAINTGIDTREAAQISQNKELLKSLGMEDRAATGTAAGDVASQAAASAKDLNTVSQGQWANLLTGLGEAQKSQIQGDIAGYDFRRAEDQAMLGRDLLNAQQAKDVEQAKLTQEKAQAKFSYAQAQQQAAASAAAAAARATSKGAKDAAAAAQKAIDNADPVTRIQANALKLGIPATSVQAATEAYYAWLGNRGTTTPAGATGWKLGSAQADAQKTAGAQLDIAAKSLLNQMLAGSYKP